VGFETFQLDRLFHFCRHLRGSVLPTPPEVPHRLKAVKFLRVRAEERHESQMIFSAQLTRLIVETVSY